MDGSLGWEGMHDFIKMISGFMALPLVARA
jgi:hypothetical protein